MGLYDYDNTIFDLMVVPEALDKDTLFSNILAETAELEVLYPNPVLFKNLLAVWSRKELDIWNRLYETTQYDYNPIENFNRTETGSNENSDTVRHGGTNTHTDAITQGGMDTHSDSRSNGGMDTHSDTRTESGSDTKEETETLGGSDTVTNETGNGKWIAGFDSTESNNNDGLVKSEREEGTATTETEYGKTTSRDSEVTYGKSESISGNVAYGKTETETGNVAYGKTENRSGSETFGQTITTETEGEHSVNAHGINGVTTTQKLIREQREIETFNIYDIIIESFKMRFCILVY